MHFRHFRGAGSRTSQPHREGRSGTQLYLVGGRDCALGGIDRARKAGFSALVVTIDTPVAGFRERDLRNGAKELLSGKLGPMLPFVSQLLVRPRWLAALLADGGLMKFENVVIPGKGPMLYADVTAALEQSVVTWDDLKWIRQAWNGPIVIKGIHTPEDARRAVDMGADALVVSNHGGRQLDGVAPTLRVLPEVVAAVGDRIEVLLDGGIRRGSDIVKALCLGARAVMAGRAYAYGLGRRAARVFRAQSTFCARISCARSSCLAVRQSRNSMEPTSMFRGTGLRNDECGMPNNGERIFTLLTETKSPQPHAENGGNDQGDPAYAHWDRQRSDGDLGLVDQPQQMPNCKNAEENARDAQSSSW